MIVQIDISDEEDDGSIEIAPDGPEDTYKIVFGALELSVNYDQLHVLFRQVRPWFEEEREP